MSVFDYRNATDFSLYEMSILSLLLKQIDISKDEFSFLDKISQNDISFKWYDDSSADVQGGFYYPSRNCIYLNRGAFTSVSSEKAYSLIDLRMVGAMPVILHEMHHYWQSRHYGILYLFMQMPLLRERLIEKSAYAVEDAAYELPFVSYGIKEIVTMKVSAQYALNCYDEIEKKFIACGNEIA